ncbi:hypothetical protein QJQ45_007562 [Haematococcus lacustris]|nr:hypothetical protein QJQ45_007562 [Haematococcus lacustris]
MMEDSETMHAYTLRRGRGVYGRGDEDKAIRSGKERGEGIRSSDFWGPRPVNSQEAHPSRPVVLLVAQMAQAVMSPFTLPDAACQGTSSSNSGPVAATGATAAAAHAVGLPLIGKAIAEQRESVFDPAPQIGVGIQCSLTGVGQELQQEMAEVAMKRHGRAKQLVVFLNAARIGTRGGWGADVVLRACCNVVCRPRGTDQLRGRVVLVDEHRTSRFTSAVKGHQPSKRSKRTEAEQAAEPTQPPKGKAKGKAAKAKAAPQPGRRAGRECKQR